ncbi:protein of unknown function [Hyphomicrobium sp. 1Nfss2.1]
MRTRSTTLRGLTRKATLARRKGAAEFRRLQCLTPLLHEVRKTDPWMTATRLLILLNVLERGSISQGELVDLLGTTEATVSRNINELDLRYRFLTVRREPPSGDQRKNRVSVTPWGRKRAREWDRAMDSDSCTA